MKILFLHLSDAHLTGKTFIDDTIIDAQVQAINAAGDFDKCCLVFSGDLSYSAKQNEYAKCKLYLRRLWKRIMDKFHPTYPVSTLMVPGNHDMDFGGNNRGRAEIARMLSSDITDEMIRAELRKFNNFYEFAEAYHCFSFNKLIDVKTYNIENESGYEEFAKANGMIPAGNLLREIKVSEPKYSGRGDNIKTYTITLVEWDDDVTTLEYSWEQIIHIEYK